MTKKKKQSRQILSCIILLLVAGSIFIAVSFGAGRRAGMGGESTLPLDTFNEPSDSSSLKESGSTPQSTVQPQTEPKESVPTSLTVDEIEFTLPADGGVLTGASLTVPVYSMTMNDHRTHTGVDIAVPLGSPVTSCADGVVASVFEDPMMGMTVTVDHGGEVTSVYKNLSVELPDGIAVGTSVSAGDVIGAVGATALVECEEEAHLHFELTVNGEYVDPAEYIKMTSLSETYEG